MSHCLINRESRDRAAASLSPKTGCLSDYVSGLHQHMVQTAQSWQQVPGNSGLVRHETQHSRYLANFSCTPKG